MEVREVDLNNINRDDYIELCNMIEDFDKSEFKQAEIIRLLGITRPDLQIDRMRKMGNICKCLFLMNNNQIIGYSFLLENKEAKYKLINISKLYVKRNYQNQGIGQLFLKLIEEYCIKKLNAQMLGLQVCDENERAYHIYKKLGFREKSHYLLKKI